MWNTHSLRLCGLPSTSWWLALSVTPRFYLPHTFPCLRLQRPLGVEKWEGGKVERTSVEESDLNSSCCTPFTFTDRHRTHTHTLTSVPDLTKPSLLRAKVKQMQSSHCYSLNKRVRMNKQRPSGGRNIAEWMRCWERGQGEVSVTMSEPQVRPLVVNRWTDGAIGLRPPQQQKLYLQHLLHLLAFSTFALRRFGSSDAVTVFCLICHCLSLSHVLFLT